MRSVFFHMKRGFGLGFLLVLAAAWGVIPANATPQHGIAMYGEPALPPDFVSLPYANPEAPKGGRMVTGNTGGFDSLNPLVRKGTPPWQLRFYIYESLMGRSWDEPFTLYGLIAESVETSDSRNWVEFTLREAAKFADGSPITVEDVIWSYEILGTKGHPRYHAFWQKIESIEQVGPRKLRITFNVADRELALIAGLRPIFKKAGWEGVDFANAGNDHLPMGSAPYTIESYEIGRNVVLRRNPAYWGADLPFRRGTHNLDELRIEFFGDGTVLFEAFKAEVLTVLREFNAEKWARQYEFPAVKSGAVVKSEIPHQKPSGMTGFVMNTRLAQFADIRVRDALLHAFNFESINDTMTGGRQQRIASYFSNSVLAMESGAATGRVAEWLAPFADDLPPEALAGYTLPQGDGTQRNRRNIRRAMALLESAGWEVVDGVMQNAAGKPLRFNILLRQGAKEQQGIANIYLKALERLGIEAVIETVDNAQYTARLAEYDFEMTWFRRSLSLSPGNEQMFYWGREGVETPGSRNLMGMDVPAAEAMIAHLLTSTDYDDFIAAARALDRVLTSGRYVIPIYQFNIGRIAHSSALHFPETLPIYGDGVEWMPGVWWYEE